MIMHAAMRWSAHMVADDPHTLLPDALRALEAIQSSPETITVVDNAPAGQPRPDVAWPSSVRWLRNPRPHSAGHSHNQAMELAFARTQVTGPADDIVLLLTPDIIVGTDLIVQLQDAFASDPHLAVIGPKLRRAHILNSSEDERTEIEFTDVLDAAGLSSGFLGRIKHVGAGAPDDGTFDLATVFAPSPACFAVRLSALRSLSSIGPWFDERGSWNDAAIGLFRRMRASHGLSVHPHAVAWRLAPRPVLR